MIPSLRNWLAATLLVAGTVTAQDDSSSGIHVRSISARDASLDEWRAANNRTSPQVIEPCPSSCKDFDSMSGSSLFPDAAALAACNETMLLHLAVQNDVGNGAPVTAIRACKADYTAEQNAYTPKDDIAALCSTPNHAIIKTSVSMGEPSSPGNDDFSLKDLLSAGSQVLNSLGAEKPSCTENVLTFGYSQSSIIGLFAGAEVHQHGLAAEVLGNFLKDAEKYSITKPTIVQLCAEDGRGADYAVGIIAGSAKNLPLAQDAVKTWAGGRCVAGANGNQDWMTVSVRVPSADTDSNSTTTSVEDFGPAAHAWGKSRLSARATCKTAQVKANDGCDAVASRCGITKAELQKFNPASGFCNTLVPGQTVCCSSGTLPDPIPPANSDGTCKTVKVISGDGCGSLATKCGLEDADFTKLHSDTKFCSSLAVGQAVCCTYGKLPDITPKPNANGTCATYIVKQDDTCATIATSHGITADKIEIYNKKTWGWNGCKLLWPDTKMCLSTGTSPFPASVSDAQCGPTIPNSKIPTDTNSANWAKLNPCPLNVCCNIWGKCGTTDDFCVISKSDSGAPGTSAPGKNGCISNCGRDIIKGSAPAETMRVAYFEAWNVNRKCLNMDVDQIDTSKYTHIHFAFANITTDFKVDISGAKDQFNRFKAMTGIKRIISFGGWDFSTMPGTYNILREATKAANRPAFQKNMISFLKDNKLDGVDLDWEYPGAPDIPDIPAGDPNAGEDYYQFLSGLKSALGSSMSVSFAAPASYWYLKAYPIEKISSKVDYIIYMTYDLHGQWDYNNKWTSPGCPTGNCLRSHVNVTETKDALSMITKAGVPSNKVVVGVSSYGRSFKMATAGCTGPACKFTGSPRVSNAAKGRCTNTAGYISDAEILDVILFGRVNKQWSDAGSDILVYNDTEWVAYMNASTKSNREKLYSSYNFAGISDWAVDLQEFLDGSGVTDPVDEDYEPDIDSDRYVECDSVYNTLDELENRMDNIPPHCMNQYIVNVEAKIMGDALKKYKKLVDDGYDAKFKIFEEYTKEQVPVQINAFMGNGDAGDFFKCEETKTSSCCGSCRYFCEENDECDDSPDCRDGKNTFEITCPTQYKGGSQGIDYYNTDIPNTTFTLQHSDAFYEAIYDDYAIEKSWIKFGNIDVRVSNGCQYGVEDINECQKKLDLWYWNYPMAGNVKVANPKDIIGDSYDNSKELLGRLNIMKATGGFDETTELAEVVDAAALPALTLQSAVDNMDQVVKEANEIEKAERESIILNFITGILFLIPVIGGAAGAGGLTTVRAALGLLGVAGEAGLLAYSVISDPDNAFMTIFSTLAGAGLGRVGWRNAAGAKRDMSNEDLGKLGPIKTKVVQIDTIRGRSCKI